MHGKTVTKWESHEEWKFFQQMNYDFSFKNWKYWKWKTQLVKKKKDPTATIVKGVTNRGDQREEKVPMIKDTSD